MGKLSRGENVPLVSYYANKSAGKLMWVTRSSSFTIKSEFMVHSKTPLKKTSFNPESSNHINYSSNK